MRPELIMSIISFAGSAVPVKYFSLKLTSTNTSPFKKIIAGIFSWVFFLSTAAWLLLLGDTLAAWLTSPEDGQFLSILISIIIFLCLYVLSLRASAPFPAIEFLVFALASLNFQTETSIPTNKLIMFLRKRALNQFLKEVQPDTQNQIVKQRENLVDHLRHQQDAMDGLNQLKNGTSVEIIDANKPFPIIFSHNPFFKYLKRLTINPRDRKAYLQLMYSQILDGAQFNVAARAPFLRQVYDFVQAIAHEAFMKRYAQFFDTISVALFKSLADDAIKTVEEPVFLLEISTTMLNKIESTYFNPLKFDTIASIRFQSSDTQVVSN